MSETKQVGRLGLRNSAVGVREEEPLVVGGEVRTFFGVDCY